MKKSKLWLPLTTTISALISLGLIIGTFATLQFSQGLPDAQGIREIELKVPLRVYSADGLLISEFGNERRIPVNYEDTPQALINAVLASEDDNFFNHTGVDFLGLIRAALANYSSGRSGQGASTITMQVARNFYLSPEKTYTRKIKEILLAIRLEQTLEKQEILALYLNKIFLGHRAYGFGAASEVYYGKSLDELTLAQTAMLAGLPKAPSSYNPIRNPERALIRRDYVLKRMHSLGWITDESYQQALNAPVTAEKHARETGLDAPHIAEMVRAQLIEQYGEGAYWQGLNVYTTITSDKQLAAASALRTGLQAYDRRHGFRGPVANIDLGKIDSDITTQTEELEEHLRVYPDSREQTPAIVIALDNAANAKLWSREAGFVTLNFDDAKWAKKYISANSKGPAPSNITDVLKRGDIVYIKPKANSENASDSTPKNWQLSQLPAISGSIISLNPNSGAIVSLVGGYDFFLNKYNRATQSIRQPGSNIKPFIYSASLEKGFTPASLISGAPIVLTDPAHGTRWRPENYSGKFFGPTRMREALSKSMNLVSIRLLRSIGIPYAREYSARFGIDMSRFSNSLTMALGSGGVKPIEMISAYSILANGGYKIQPYFIESITDRNNQLIYTAPKPVFCDECILDYIAPAAQTETEDDDQALENQPDESIALEPPVEPIINEESDIAPTASETYSAPRVMTHANNFLTVSMLKDVVKRGTARKALRLERSDLAGKTGTTNDYVDAWFSGFNSKVVTTVWVGFDKPRTMGRGEAGSKAALPIWIDYMQTGLKGIEMDTETSPPYIEPGFVDRSSGQRTLEDDPMATEEFFVLNELTPEYALLADVENTQLEALDTDTYRSDGKQAFDELENSLEAEQSFDTPDNDDEATTPYPSIQERIIENEEETEGLF